MYIYVCTNVLSTRAHQNDEKTNNNNSNSKLSAYCVNSNIIHTWANYLNDVVVFFFFHFILHSFSLNVLLLLLIFGISRLQLFFFSKIVCIATYSEYDVPKNQFFFCSLSLTHSIISISLSPEIRYEGM